MGVGHGKLILLGEHGVVYGRPALAAALARGAEAVAVPAPRPRLEVEPWGVAFDADDSQGASGSDLLRRAFIALHAPYAERYGERASLCVRVKLALPGRAGLGGSAALSVAVVRALDAAFELEREPSAIAEAALAAERVFHGNPSGIDTALAAHGGVALFRKGAPLERLRPAGRFTFVVGDSGEHGDTLDTVAAVKRQHDRDRARVEQIFDAMEAIVINGKSALAAGEQSRFGQLMVLNHKLLAALMLSTTRLEEMNRAAEQAGALGTKLTGGGGGGCMIALCEGTESIAAVEAALRGLGCEAFSVEVSA